MIFKSLQSFFRGQNTKSQNNNFLNGYMDKLYLFKRTVIWKHFESLKINKRVLRSNIQRFRG